MKKTWVVIIILTLAALVACSNGESDDIIEDLNTQIKDLSGECAILQLENITLKEEINEYRDKTIPEKDKALNEAEVMIENLEAKNKSNIGYLRGDRKAFKNDIKDILLYMSQEDIIPVYIGEKALYTDEHLRLIYDYYSEYSTSHVLYEDLENEYEPVIYPIKITPTEVDFTSQFDEYHYYNVVHYRTVGLPPDGDEIKSIRAPGAVSDGLIETFIIEIVKDGGVWKINYTGYGG